MTDYGCGHSTNNVIVLDRSKKTAETPKQVMPSVCPACNERLLFSYRYGYKKHECHKEVRE